MTKISHFILSSDSEFESDHRKLLSYSGSAKAGKMVLTLKVEVSGYAIAYALESLEAIQRAHAAKPKVTKPMPATKAKVIGQTKLLGLPSPDQFET